MDLILIEEHAIDQTVAVSEYPMGRLPSIDFRDRNHLMRMGASAPVNRYRYYMTAPAMDQGRLPHCVGFGWQQFLLSAPVKNTMWKTPAELYHECQIRDEWAGEAYEGTSVRGGARALQEFGYIKEYSWAFDADRVMNHILTTGPVVIGVNWYDGMLSTDDNGYINPVGPLVGGHCVMVKGGNLDKVCPDGSRGAFRIINSWGLSWGEKGMAWVSAKTMDRLIKEWGEAATASEIKFKVEA